MSVNRGPPALRDLVLWASLLLLSVAGALHVNATIRLVALSASMEQNADLLANFNDDLPAGAVSTRIAEQTRLRDRQQALEREALGIDIAMVLAAALGLAAALWQFAARRRETARWVRVDGELKGLNAKLEDRVEARAEEVARSREILGTVIESMPDTVFLKDVRDDFRYVLFNRAGEKLLSLDRARLLGNADHEVFPSGNEAAVSLREDLEVVRSGKPLVSRERSLATERGVRIIQSWKFPIPEADGEPRFVLGIVRDLTDQRALENQLRQIHRMDAVGHLTGGIAHDFNNILSIILGNVDLLREEQIDGTESAEIADEALGAASHGVLLVRRLLAFAGMQHLDPVALNLSERLPDIVAMLRRTLGANIDTRVKAAEDLWPALVDPTQVDDALVNLALNARDAMPDGGELTIETRNVVLDADLAGRPANVIPGQYILLAVGDTGTGMAPNVIASAIEPFFTTKEECSGTGLGLSQVYGWVKQSGGHLEIDSERGRGTKISLYLPRAKSAPDDADAVEPGAGTETEPRPNGHETILVVEDNPGVRGIVLRQLRDLGYSTIEAKDGETALNIVRAGRAFDLLMTDVVMPGGMTGYELAGHVRELRPDLKLLFTSGYAESASRSAQFAIRGPLLSKPYSKRHLGQAVRAILDKGEGPQFPATG